MSFTVQELYRADQTVGVSENTKRLIDLENVWKDFRTKGKRPKNPAPFYYSLKAELQILEFTLQCVFFLPKLRRYGRLIFRN